LVKEHAEQFAGVKHSIGEFGGFPFWVGGAKMYPIHVTERVGCQLELVIRGAGGHGAMPLRDGAMAKLGRILTRIDKKRLPIHITPVTRMMVEGMAEATTGATRILLKQLLNPRLSGPVLDGLGERMRPLEPLFRHTINATIVQGGEKINVVPSEIVLKLDGRMLPGFTAAQMMEEVRQLVGETVEIRQIGEGVPNSNQLDMSQFATLAGILRELDPTGHPVPYMLPAVSDARHFAKLGIQNYGFLPLNLPDGFNFSATIHAADERVPVEAIQFGTRGVGMFLERYGR
jgi:acetylornithine deacetylase/succinyl-diaminopimelate desuccinylase-like protein